jgi:hypothetical protein
MELEEFAIPMLDPSLPVNGRAASHSCQMGTGAVELDGSKVTGNNAPADPNLFGTIVFI